MIYQEHDKVRQTNCFRVDSVQLHPGEREVSTNAREQGRHKNILTCFF